MFPAIFSENTAFAKVKKRAVWDTHTHAWLRAVWWTRTVTNVLLIRKSDSSKHIRPTALFLFFSFFLQKLKWALEMITRCAFAARTVNVGHCHPFNCKFSWLSLMKMKLVIETCVSSSSSPPPGPQRSSCSANVTIHNKQQEADGARSTLTIAQPAKMGAGIVIYRKVKFKQYSVNSARGW